MLGIKNSKNTSEFSISDQYRLNWQFHCKFWIYSGKIAKYAKIFVSQAVNLINSQKFKLWSQFNLMKS